MKTGVTKISPMKTGAIKIGAMTTGATRFAVATLGCKVNQYDSAMIESRLGARGMERCEFDEVADVYIVNTCTVTDRADAESLKLARRARRLNPHARVVMTGCLAQANPAVLAAAAEIDAVVGLGRPGDLERAALGEASSRVMVSNLRKERAPIELGAVALEGRTRAFLKVQEGCDQFCSFCIVPTSRGTSRSVEPRRIFAALDELAASGFREVILTGVHLGGYGRDLDPPVDLETLLEMVDERSPISRVRISSLDPEELSDRILEIMAASDKFCPHLHLPLQAGTDATLVRMRRRYDLRALQRPRRTYPGGNALGSYRHGPYRRVSRRDDPGFRRLLQVHRGAAPCLLSRLPVLRESGNHGRQASGQGGGGRDKAPRRYAASAWRGQAAPLCRKIPRFQA